MSARALPTTVAVPKPITTTPRLSPKAPAPDFVAPRSGHDFARVRVEVDEGTGAAPRVFDDEAAHASADRLGAYAYSWRGDVYLGPRLGRPGAPTRSEAIRHELVHAAQSRNPGRPAATADLEREASHPPGGGPVLAADPEQVLGLWWVVPVAVGVYILLRPKVANAPGPDDRPVASPSDTQIVGEALSIFAVPAGVAGVLGRLGYSVIAGYAVGGAASAVSFRGVQDTGAGQFSRVEAYVVDATTGAVIGVVLGGAVRLFGGTGAAAPSNPSLVHLTNPNAAAGIARESVLRGSQGIYALPGNAANQGTAMRVMRTLLRPRDTASVVPIPGQAAGLFSRPLPVGPASGYQYLAGVHRAPAGAINMATGGFTASTRALANVTGQFWPYGMDGLIWATGVGAGVTLSPSSPDAYRDRGMFSPLFGLVGNQSPLPMTERTDGPFLFVDPTSAGPRNAGQSFPDTTAAPGGRPGTAYPSVILVYPADSGTPDAATGGPR